MALLLPPFSKLHIIAFGTLALIVSVFYLLVFANNPDSQTTTISVTPITSTELREDFAEPLSLVQSGKITDAWVGDNFLILDVRSADEFRSSHIKGSVSAPAQYMSYGNYDPEDHIVIYSTVQSELSKAKEVLAEKDIKNIYVLDDTIDTLKANGYEIEQDD